MADTKLSSLIRNPAILDEDDMASDSATEAASQQSIKAYSDAIKASISTPIYWNMLTNEPDAVGQGTWIHFAQTSHLYNGAFQNSTGVDIGGNGDNFTMNFRCPAGTYTLRFNSTTSTFLGIIDVYIDASEEGSFDAYSAAIDYNNIEEISGLVLTSGEHALKFQIDGKNALSSAWYMRLSGITLQRTP